MSAWTSAVAILVAYLLGSISFSYVIVRVLKGVDIRTIGSGNAGATNVLRACGMAPALLALVLDIGKGLAAVLVARWMGASTPVLGAVGLAAVAGHMYPVFLGFRGGKGVATAAGTLGSLALLPTLAAALLFAVIVVWKRYVSLGSVVAAVAFPFLVVAFGVAGWLSEADWPWLVAASGAIAALIVWKHRSNLERLRSGTESRLGSKARS